MQNKTGDLAARAAWNPFSGGKRGCKVISVVGPGTSHARELGHVPKLLIRKGSVVTKEN